MGIGSNLMVEMQEQEIEEENYRNIIDKAAHYVVNEKMSREEAFHRSKNLQEQRHDKDNYVVIDEDTGEIEYLQSELQIVQKGLLQLKNFASSSIIFLLGSQGMESDREGSP